MRHSVRAVGSPRGGRGGIITAAIRVDYNSRVDIDHLDLAPLPNGLIGLE